MTPEQRDILEGLVRRTRARLAGDTLSTAWEVVFDAEMHLNGTASPCGTWPIMSVAECIESLRGREPKQ